uniref:Paraplegin n=1 Tax=Hirondellea gigas TaxID=1518452 RepID=A0A2P2HZ44_9CRUS
MQLLSKLVRTVAWCSRAGLLHQPVTARGFTAAAAARALSREYIAAASVLCRSGVPVPLQQQLIRASLLHTTAAAPYNGSEPGGDDKKGRNSNDDEDEKRNKRMQSKAAWWMVTAYLAVVLLGILFPSNGPTENMIRYVSWNEFVHQMLGRGEVDRVLVRTDANAVIITLHEGAVIKGKKVDQLQYHLNVEDIKKVEEKIREVERSLGLAGSQGVPVDYSRPSDSTTNLLVKLLLGGLVLAFLFSGKGSGKMPFKMDPFTSMGRAKFTAIDPLMPGSGRGVKFSDVAGAKEAKQEIMEFVDFLKNPLKYRALGAKSPKGALLLGPPGCGKTMLAKAVATEGQVPFLAMNGPEFIEVVGGLGAARVRDLFKEAKKRSPCIIYIDEIDAIGRKRSGTGGMGGDGGESEQTLNQLLVEMDGIGSKEGVVMIASTNRMDLLDKALLRPGRFDRHIMLDLPTLIERQEILEHHLKSIVMEQKPQHYSKRLAALTLGFSGAELANVVNEAALYAARNAHKTVTGQDLEYAVERVIGGAEKKSSTVSPEERRVVAYHEAGHALVGWLLEHTDALLKVTIVPRTSHALGFAQYQPKDQKLYTQDELLDRVCMALGGRAAESLVFNRITTGAMNDLERVTDMAYAQVRNYGFSPVVGQVSFPQGAGRRPYSNALTQLIDSEANKIVFNSYKRTEGIILQNMDKLKQLAEALLEQETLTYESIEKLWGPPPHGSKLTVEPLQFEAEVQSWKGAGSEQNSAAEESSRPEPRRTSDHDD